MPDADPCRRALTPIEGVALFASDAPRAAGIVMAGAAADAADAAYLAVNALPAGAVLR
ncbi:hypothetical protein [Methylobacterium flocculans]|uniref:hypothetical protein n=1 Tax=Methylobacterium flocculans TaxID=2984843 RepID=UPI0021F33552|nr:hypothetical protein [Methylobacterium sp. FF17]